MGIWSSIKKSYTSIDKSIGGVLPGGYVAPPKISTASQTIPQKSTIISQPQAPPMSVTTPKGNVVQSTQVQTQTASQYTSSYKTTADTGTGYNPATGVQEGKTYTAPTNLPNISQPVPTSVQQRISSVSQTGLATPTSIQQKQSFLQTAGSYLYGEKGKQFVGISLPSYYGLNLNAKPTYTFQQIKTKLQSTNLFGKTVAEFIPTTPLGVASFAAIPYGFSKLPSVLRIGGGLTFGYLGTKTALTPTLKPEQRIAGGIIGGLGFTGAAIETYPYVSGFRKVTNPIKTTEILGKDVSVIKGIKGTKGKYDIALIPSGDIQTGNKPAFISTAYGFSKEYQTKYIGKTGTIVTSAKDLIPTGIKGVVKVGRVTPTTEIFATPFDIKTGMAQTRVSRLGIVSAEDLIKLPKNAQISFGISKPQIVSFEKTKITKFGGGGTFRAIGKPSTELEVTTLQNIYGKKIGTTKIGLTKVDIFSGKLIGAGKGIPSGFSKLKISSPTSQTTSGYSAISSAFNINKIFSGISKPTTTFSTSIPSKRISITSVDYYPSVPSRPSRAPSFPSRPYIPSRVSPPSVSTPPSFSPPSVSFMPSRPSYPYRPSRPKYPISTISTPVLPSVPTFNLGFDFGMATRIYKGKQRFKYMPSFEAFAFKIRGRQPKGRETGARARPIPKGFSLAFNQPSYKFNTPIINFNRIKRRR